MHVFHSHLHRARRFAHMRGAHRGDPFGRREGHRGPRRGGRVFDHGDLRWVLLKLIADKPAHGYELIRMVEESLGGAYSPSPGVIYPTLTLLEDLGYIAEVEGAGPRRAYAATDAGRAALAENEAQVASIFRRIAEVAERAGGGPAPQIVRAMENLRTALRLKLERGRLTEAEVAAVAAALDAAARAIETDAPRQR